jgi:hypothetical protein
VKKTKDELQSICNKILESDSYIRFVGIPNKMGRQIVSCYRNELIPLLTPQEIELLSIESVLRMKTRRDFESKLGRPIYSFTLYEKIKRAAIALNTEEYPIVMLSFDRQADPEDTILNKILPIIRKEGIL